MFCTSNPGVVCFQGNFGSSVMQILAWYISSQPQRALFMLLRVLVGFGASLFYKGFQQNGQFFGPSCLKDWKMLVPVVKLVKKDWTNQISIIIVILSYTCPDRVSGNTWCRNATEPSWPWPCETMHFSLTLQVSIMLSTRQTYVDCVFRCQLGTVPDMSTFHFPSDSQWFPVKPQTDTPRSRRQLPSHVARWSSWSRRQRSQCSSKQVAPN